ncbi:toll/interleukin-1 receptor domain-containing protein [Algoriphagus sp. A40]|uniref:toll/interleukin-1 receptor domain-containing protein n=1 Tax=Algoriphagus sp. A40 TaxID=1945863 RepID=UPI0009870E4A|nr:toll/interleukin-1 receptor domain-containing protein [Algoriphagus sp. A40]OOG72180.1 hypothetical protein B0E43_16255 [Algoriphagus sp. A40]
MKQIWLTYSWKDNEDHDVDFIAQEIEKTGIKVNLDRWTIVAGKRLWEQIEKFIVDQNHCDGWIFYITQNSLGSEPCKEEFAYALDRALNSRENSFPIIGLAQTNIDKSILPAAIKTRLYVSMTDEDWKDRILSSIENRAPNIQRPVVQPYTLDFHQFSPPGINEIWNIIEIRPRAGSWTPSFAGILQKEKNLLKPFIKYGPRGVYNQGTALYYPGESESTDGKFWLMYANNEVTTSMSLYLVCKSANWPTTICFGVNNNQPQFLVENIGTK